MPAGKAYLGDEDTVLAKAGGWADGLWGLVREGAWNAEKGALNLETKAFQRGWQAKTQGPWHLVSATFPPTSQRQQHSQAQEEAGLRRELGLLFLVILLFLIL